MYHLALKYYQNSLLPCMVVQPLRRDQTLRVQLIMKFQDLRLVGGRVDGDF